MDKSVLMVAYHYPPAQASGTQRAVGFGKYLSQFGYRPLILSVHPMAYEHCDAFGGGGMTADVVVVRSKALDTARHLAIRGRYARALALPDRWSTWLLTAIPAGLWMIWKYKPKMIWSTYPIATSLLIGWALSRVSGLPWIVDLRDPLVIGRHPLDPTVRKLFIKLEARVLQRCDRIVVTTQGLMELLTQRYPNVAADKWKIIANGYDDEVFDDPEIIRIMESKPTSNGPERVITLLHSGTLYTGPEERNPAPFLDVLAGLVQSGRICGFQGRRGRGIRMRVVFRATGHDEQIRAMIQARQLEDLVVLQPTLPYRESLLEMVAVDGLLLFQGEAFDRLVPAKLFEYLRSGRPVFALVGNRGDARKILEACDAPYIVPLEDRHLIGSNLVTFLDDLVQNRPYTSPGERVKIYSRWAGARALAELLDDMLRTREAADG
ncbi:MAG: glycosyltransferase [Magnetococcales bacterium]|nr:glycosyltransferase [Magnetococcales bacterium]